MNRFDDRVRDPAHAHALLARGGAMPPEGLPSGEILDSWVRCMRAGIDMAAPPSLQVVGAADLARRRASDEHVRRLAQAELETLASQIAGSNFLLAFADPEGVILDTYADQRFATSPSGGGIIVGSQWSEALCGTNGLGTALATGHAVSVSGPEHYLFSLGDIFCTAAPVRDASGAVVGVLDASSYYESRQRHTQALVQMAATHMENQLLVHQMREQVLLAIHPRAEFLGTLSAGLLAFDGAGRLQAVNARGRQLLAGLELEAGTSFEDLFGEPIGHVLARLHRQPEARLRDVLGSTLVAALLQPMSRPVWQTAAQPVAAPQRHVAAPVADSGFVAADPAVEQACRLVQAAVRMRVPILIRGETGTGKELLARHAHQLSGRSGAFVAVNCGALPAELIEAELFGHVGGAFTGARSKGSIGLIASADGGTLLLDELGELPLALQPALLRFLDDQTVRPVGGLESRRVDVQLLAASHVDLGTAVAARQFRADLLYRLDTVSVTLPPLRQRGDFAAAVRHVLAAIDPHARLDEAAIERLSHHTWPGNFRELRSVLTRALLSSGRSRLTLADIEPGLPPLGPARLADPLESAAGSALQLGATELVRREYERSGGSVSLTARTLGVSRTTVYRHLRAHPDDPPC